VPLPVIGGGMTIVRPKLTVPQSKFVNMDYKFKAYVSGFGGGKTWAGCADLAKHFYEFPRITAAYFAPSYPQIRDIFYPTVEEAMFDWGLTVKVRSANHEVSVYQGRNFMGQILCRSMEDPGSIVGFKIGKAMVDELDVMTRDKAAQAWRKIIARMRFKVDGLQNGISVTTTPEGFKFTYEQFVRQVRADPSLAALYGLIQASTYDNEANLPADYIDSLRRSYPPALIDAYINGQFVNLTTGCVYQAYDRIKNASTECVQPGEALFIGMDFNVGKMAAITHVKRNSQPHAVDEIVNAYDTPDMIRRIQERYWTFQGGIWQKTRQIRVYPDASGNSRRSVNASETDIALLRAAGFVVCAPEANPPVKDRINAMNGMFCNAEGLRRYFVNADKCPTYSDCLEQQPWAANGEPDKTLGHDHACFSGETLVETKAGIFRFDAIPPTGEVMGPFGEWVPYHSAGKTGNKRTVRVDFTGGYFILCTEDHRFLTEDGSWVKAKDLKGHACVLSVKMPKNFRAQLTTAVGNISPIQPAMGSAVFIEPSGVPTMGRSQKGLTSTISTGTGITIKSKTSCASLEVFISEITDSPSQSGWRMLGAHTNTSPRHGTPHQKGKSGIASIIWRWRTCFEPGTKRFAHVVGSHLWQPRASRTCQLGIAQKHVKHMHEGRVELTTLIAGASSVGRNSLQIDTVLAKSVSCASPQGAVDVYCLTVPDFGCFRLTERSPITSNCDAGGYFIHFEYPIIHKSGFMIPFRM
jgi:hypothetical protein